MQRAKIRRYVLVILVALAVVSMFPSFDGDSRRNTTPRAHKPDALTAKAHGNVRATFDITK